MTRLSLTPREAQSAAMFDAGMTDLDIAKRLGVAIGTVVYYRSIVNRKRGTSIRANKNDVAHPSPHVVRRRLSLYEIRRIEVRRIVDEVNPVNLRGTLPTPISSWVF